MALGTRKPGPSTSYTPVQSRACHTRPLPIPGPFMALVLWNQGLPLKDLMVGNSSPEFNPTGSDQDLPIGLHTSVQPSTPWVRVYDRIFLTHETPMEVGSWGIVAHRPANPELCMYSYWSHGYSLRALRARSSSSVQSLSAIAQTVLRQVWALRQRGH